LKQQATAILDNKPLPEGVYPHPIGFNLFPHIDVFLENGLCREEEKMVKETQKIMEAPIPVCPTTVRVPVFFCHSEMVNLELTREMTPETARDLLSKSPSVIIMDSLSQNSYPTPLQCQDRDEVFVGRIRRDPSVSHGLNLWVVADNLRRGAATNGVLIYQSLVERGQL
jgi:aspartate-semialdehyde dehydrogenase